MITDADIVKLSKVFATKNDLDRFATNDDLKKFATKDDLHDMRVYLSDMRKDLNVMRTGIRDLGNELGIVKNDVHGLKNGLVEMEKRMTKTIVGAIVEVYEVFEKQDRELNTFKYEHQIVIKDHESRIRVLEQPTL